MNNFEKVLEDWMAGQITEERNKRRRELLENGLGHGTKEFLRTIWYPTVGNLDHLYPEWETRDYSNKYRYLDLAYMPGNAKGCIEIHGYKSHARDIEAWRFKDLCMKQAYLTIEGWLFLPIAYLSIADEPEACKQLVLSYIGKFISTPTNTSLEWIENEILRFARGIMRPFNSAEVALHLQRSDRQARRLLDNMVANRLLVVVADKKRYRYFQLTNYPH